MTENNEALFYERLVNAIIFQAVCDYQAAYRVLSRRPNDIYANRELVELKRFFRSDLFRCMTTIDGDWLMEQIEKAPATERGRKTYNTLY